MTDPPPTADVGGDEPAGEFGAGSEERSQPFGDSDDRAGAYDEKNDDLAEPDDGDGAERPAPFDGGDQRPVPFDAAGALAALQLVPQKQEREPAPAPDDPGDVVLERIRVWATRGLLPPDEVPALPALVAWQVIEKSLE